MLHSLGNECPAIPYLQEIRISCSQKSPIGKSLGCFRVHCGPAPSIDIPAQLTCFQMEFADQHRHSQCQGDLVKTLAVQVSACKSAFPLQKRRTVLIFLEINSADAPVSIQAAVWSPRRVISSRGLVPVPAWLDWRVCPAGSCRTRRRSRPGPRPAWTPSRSSATRPQPCRAGATGLGAR